MIYEDIFLQRLDDKCKRFSSLLNIQRHDGFSEEDFLLCTKLLASISIPSAIKLSEMSAKHNERSEARIHEYNNIDDPKKLRTKCSSFGCSTSEVEACFGKARFKDGKMTNSPFGILNKISKVEISSSIIDSCLSQMVNGETNAYMNNRVQESLIYLKANDKKKFEESKDRIVKLGNTTKRDFNSMIKEFEKEQSNNNLLETENSSNPKIYYNFMFDSSGNLSSLNRSKIVTEALSDIKFALVPPDKLFIYDSGKYIRADSNETDRLIKTRLNELVPNSWNPRISKDIFKSICVEVPREQDLNKTEGLINLQNGLLNPLTGQLIEHTHENFTVSQLPYSYDPEADCPMFIEYLKSTFNNNFETICTVQEMIGYCLTEDVRADVAFILKGEGANGKSVLAKVMELLVGKDNYFAASLKKLEQPKNIAELHGKLLNIATENEIDSSGFNTETIKQITSGDLLNAEKKYEAPFNFHPYCKLLFAVNRMPYSRDKSYALGRRLIVLEFKNIYRSDVKEEEGIFKKRVVGLDKKLAAELEGIFNFGIVGYRRLVKHNHEFTLSNESKEALEDYRIELNPILDFFKARIIVKPGARVSAPDIRKTFDLFCEENNYKPSQNMGTRKFLREFRSILRSENIDFYDTPSNNITYFWGINFESSNGLAPKIQENKSSSKTKTKRLTFDKWLKSRKRNREIDEMLQEDD